MKKHLLILIAALAQLVSCVYPFEIGQQDGGGNLLVIEGDLLIGSVSDIKLSYTTSLGGDTPFNAPTGQVFAENDAGRTFPSVVVGGGYRINLEDAEPSRSYRLRVSLDGGGEYASEWMFPRKAPVIDDVGYDFDGYLVKFNISLHSDDGEQYFRWSFDEDWEYNSMYDADIYYVPDDNGGHMEEFGREEGIYHCWRKASSTAIMFTTTKELLTNTVTEKNFYNLTSNNQKLSVLYSMNLKAESLSPDSYKYWQNVFNNSENVGNLFAPIPSELRGNIFNMNDPSEQVMGYVNVSDVATKRIFIDNAETRIYSGGSRRLEEEELVQVLQEDWSYYYFSRRYLPVFYQMGMGGNEYYWALARCVDCTLQGGTKDKPSFWPNNHY